MITFSTRPGHIDEPLHQSLKKFPAGEVDMALAVKAPYATAIFSPESLHEDLVYLRMWASAREDQSKTLHLPYAPGARADRDMHGARVYCDIMNDLECDQVIICDPHSPVVVDYLNNVHVVTITDIFEANNFNPRDEGFTGIIAPDKGAVERASQVAKRYGLPVHCATKSRDFETGKFLGYMAPTDLDMENGKYLVIDDICDGGGTFALLAQSLNLDPDQLALYVTHGIFSGRALENLTGYSQILTTTSFSGGARALMDAGLNVRTFDVEKSFPTHNTANSSL